jgi:ABC-type transport system substrate-binding protein
MILLWRAHYRSRISSEPWRLGAGHGPQVRGGLVYEFVLRKGAKLRTAEAVTADDVKFSFERYRGIYAKTLKERVAAVETPDPGHVRFRLRQPWPDFMSHYGTKTTAAAWIVPRKYVEEPALGLIPGYAFSAPYEDVKLRAK